MIKAIENEDEEMFAENKDSFDFDIIDSGASDYLYQNYIVKTSKVILPNHNSMDIQGIGELNGTTTENQFIKLKRVTHVTDIKRSILSVSKLLEDGYGVDGKTIGKEKH
ncbi:hypothetical protein O9G_006357 [Rozella allomycis CSF55]|uniref:Retrovirus-related Pol polyprotein from transposon TNT 1-94-like beta-barrel domain-containing protein n=1 Tax=Rozella allomycis (strain CSF55) TaxID=988480 RepID=A0A075B125_ROZAC|nr:hypothetical protein O9G_006357 [Rozella allomycis CSF55]|eukprot:EPZ36221.1 hypothetical protein O9G_006357 [Rozella allomycis CSF55]